MENESNETPAPPQHDTLLAKWRYIMKDVTSPDSFIDASLYYVIAASLQRRVWIGPQHMPIFPNNYTILVGEPGVGKGLMIKPVNELLRYHKFNVKKANGVERPVDEDAAKIVNMDEVREMMSELQGQFKGDKKQNDKEPNYLIPVAANNITYEALVEHLQKSFRFIAYDTFNEKGEPVKKKYTYHSLCFALTELGSLLGKHTKTTIDFLIDVYDCVDYTYKTKHCGTNIITKSCMSFYAGSTPQFMQEAFDDSIIGEGFASRVLFIYESIPRFHKFIQPERDDAQCRYWIEMLERVEKLSRLYGQMQYSQEAVEYMTHYFECIHPVKRANTNTRLVPYYERKKLHTIKLAMAIHFCDSDSMTIELQDCLLALDFLARMEKKMHLAMTFGGKNFLAKISQQVEKYVTRENRPVTFIDIWKEFIGDVREDELNEVLDFLRRTNKLDYSEQIVGDTRLLAYTRYGWRPPMKIL